MNFCGFLFTRVQFSLDMIFFTVHKAQPQPLIKFIPSQKKTNSIDVWARGTWSASGLP